LRKRKILTVIVFILFILSFRYNEITLVDNLTKFNTEDLDINGYRKDHDDFSGLIPSYDEEKVEHLNLITALSNDKNVMPKGRVLVPGKIDVPIFEGINNAHLMKGAAEQVPRSKVVAGGKGNYILAGHSWIGRPGKLFESLQEVKVGDLVYITDRHNLYVYRINIAETLHKSNPYLLNVEANDKKLITLYSCTGGFRNPPYRFTAQGELEKSYSLDDLSVEEFNKIVEKGR